MNRRGFIKNSVGALLFGALSSNKVLASVIEKTPNDSLNVLLYLIQCKNGDWKVKGTKWTKIKSAKLSQFEYNLDTFKPLEIVDYTIVNNLKEKYWKQYNCKGRCPKNVNYLASYKSGLKAKESGQFYEAVKKSYGASHRIHKEWWKEHGKKIGELNKQTGHLQMLHDVYGKHLGKKYGKLGAEKVVKEKLGIHSATKEQRSIWGKESGKIGGKVTSSKYDMKERGRVGGKKTTEKYGKSVFANNLITFEVKEFDSIRQAERYCEIQAPIIRKILRRLQPKTRCGWTFNYK